MRLAIKACRATVATCTNAPGISARYLRSATTRGYEGISSPRSLTCPGSTHTTTERLHLTEAGICTIRSKSDTTTSGLDRTDPTSTYFHFDW